MTLEMPDQTSSLVESHVFDDLLTAESLYFNMFEEYKTEHFRRLLMYVVYKTIANDPGITLSKLQWMLSEDFAFSENDVETAVSAISNKRIFNAVSKYHLKRSGRTIIHLRLRKNCQELINAWISGIENSYPEFKAIKA